MVRGIDSLISLSDFSFLSNKMSTSRYISREVLCPKENLSRPQPQEILQPQQVGLLQAPFKSLFLPWVPVHMRLCVLLQEWSLCFSQSYKTLVIKTCWPSNALGAPLPDARPPQDRESDGLRNFTPVGELLWCNYSSVCGLPTCVGGRVCNLFYCNVPLLPSPCDFFFVFGCRISSVVGSSLLYWWFFG